MNHLTDEQLSALLDGAMSERERAEAEAHVAGCDACRERLAELGALDASLDLVPAMEAERARVQAHAERFRQAAKRRNLSTGASDTQIVPLLIGGNTATLAAQARLEQLGLLGIAIRPPTVPEGEARLRLSFSAAHRDEDVTALCNAIAELGSPA